MNSYKKRLTSTIFMLGINIFLPTQLTALTNPLSFKKVSSFFSTKYPQEESLQKEFAIGKQPTIYLDTQAGSINIRTRNNNKVSLKATKKAYDKETLPSLRIYAQKRDPNTLSIKTMLPDEKVKGEIDYELTVPEKATLKIAAQTGPITIQKTAGNVTATTVNGIINTYDTRGTLDISTKTAGAIHVHNSYADLKAVTATGSITIENSYKQVTAQTQRGCITARCKELPALNTLSLATTSGSINLAVPAGTSAALKANTGTGCITCAHYVTLNPLTTQLNREAWNRFKKEVDGILGTGDALIKLSAGHGSIKITELKTE